MCKIPSLILFFVCLCPLIVQAEPTEKKILVQEIHVDGLHFLTKDQFLSMLPIHVGDTYDEVLASSSLNTLFNSGSFTEGGVASKKLPNDGGVLLFYSMKERPWIKSIDFKGNEDISSSSLKTKMLTTEKSFLDESTLKKDIEMILAQYQGQGYVGTKIDINRKTNADGSQDIIFHIAEGEKLSVQGIHIYGTSILFPAYLKSDFMTLKEPFLFNLIKYPLIPQAFEMEKSRIVQLAKNKGFMDFSVIRSRITASISYRPTLEHMTRKLREFSFSKNLIDQYKTLFTQAFQERSQEKIENMISQIKKTAQDILKTHPKKFDFNDFEIFLRGLEIEGKTLLNVEPLITKNLPPGIEFRVDYTDSSLSGYIVDFFVSEGLPYVFAGVQIMGDNSIDSDQLKAQFLTLVPGNIYDDGSMERFKNSIAQYYRDKGYFGVIVQDTPVMDKQRQVISHKYVVQEGQKMHINKMYIQGNQKTKTYVVDRELRIKEGDVFSQTKIATSQRLLQRTGYFKNIDIIPSPGPEENLLDLNWKLEEQKTGSLQLGGGYGTETGFSVFGSISESNFLGTGINATGKVTFGQYERGAQASFSSNYVGYAPFGWSIAAGYDWIREQTSPRYDRNHDGVWDKIIQRDNGKYYFVQQGDDGFGYYFDENRSGNFNVNPGSVNPDGSVNFAPTPADDIYSTNRYFDRQILFLDLGGGYSFADFWTVNLIHSTMFSKYGNPHNINIGNLLVDQYYSLKSDLISQQWSYSSHIDLGISFNNTNSPLSPSTGVNFRFGMAFYGIEGGYDRFLRLDTSFAGYVPILDLKDQDFKFVWATGIRVSSINPLFGGADTVRLHYENQLGFNTMEEVRGWSDYIDDSDLLGLGKVSFGTELRASIPHTNDLLWLVGFFDGGYISDKVSSLPYEFDKFLYSAGFGIRLDFVSFPVRFYLAQRLLWDKYFFRAQGGLTFEFSVTSAF